MTIKFNISFMTIKFNISFMTIKSNISFITIQFNKSFIELKFDCWCRPPDKTKQTFWMFNFPPDTKLKEFQVDFWTEPSSGPGTQRRACCMFSFMASYFPDQFKISFSLKSVKYVLVKEETDPFRHKQADMNLLYVMLKFHRSL